MSNSKFLIFLLFLNLELDQNVIFFIFKMNLLLFKHAI